MKKQAEPMKPRHTHDPGEGVDQGAPYTCVLCAEEIVEDEESGEWKTIAEIEEAQ